MCHDETTQGHCYRAEREQTRCHSQIRARRSKIFNGEPIEQIDCTQTEEGDMSKAIEPAFVAGITAEPLFVMEKETQHHSGNEPEQNPEPGNDEIDVGRQHIHEATVKDCCPGALIDKSLQASQKSML